jgi:DNA recombination protein RmuC
VWSGKGGRDRAPQAWADVNAARNGGRRIVIRPVLTPVPPMLAAGEKGEPMQEAWIAVALLAGVVLGAGVVWRLRPDRTAELAQAEATLRGRDEVIRLLHADAERDRAALAAYREQQTAQASELATLREQVRALSERQQTEEAARKVQAEQFELLAKRQLEAATRTLAETSQARLDPLLTPLRERLAEFQKKVEETYQAEARERFSLQNEIGRALATTESLSRALKGQSQMRGALGETMLERVLQAAGLQPGISYVLQGKGLDLRGENGGLLKPDAVVHLPDGNCIVIDSKLALNDFAAWAAADDGPAREAALAAFVAAVRRHVADLAGKKYQDNAKLRAPDFVLLYMPFDHALATVMQADPDLLPSAWRQRVAIVGPNTLVATMGVVARTWQYELNRRNAQQIADEAAKLLDRMAEFAAALEDVGTAIRKAAEAHEEARKRMFTGNGNIARRAETLRRLGVKARKEIPASLAELDPVGPDGAADPDKAGAAAAPALPSPGA